MTARTAISPSLTERQNHPSAATDLTPLLKLEKLLQENQHLWRGRDNNTPHSDGLHTGFPALDALLPDGGWPKGALLEVIVPRWGTGELQLMLPALAALSRQQRWSMWINPPFIPYAPALAEAGVSLDHTLIVTPRQPTTETAWSMEKALRASTCAIVMAWTDRLPDRTVRRLQLAAEQGDSLGVLFHSKENGPSPAAIRIRLEPTESGLEVQVLKARGGYRYRKVHLAQLGVTSPGQGSDHCLRSDPFL